MDTIALRNALNSSFPFQFQNHSQINFRTQCKAKEKKIIKEMALSRLSSKTVPTLFSLKWLYLRRALNT